MRDAAADLDQDGRWRLGWRYYPAGKQTELSLFLLDLGGFAVGNPFARHRSPCSARTIEQVSQKKPPPQQTQRSAGIPRLGAGKRAIPRAQRHERNTPTRVRRAIATRIRLDEVLAQSKAAPAMPRGAK